MSIDGELLLVPLNKQFERLQWGTSESLGSSATRSGPCFDPLYLNPQNRTLDRQRTGRRSFFIAGANTAYVA